MEPTRNTPETEGPRGTNRVLATREDQEDIRAAAEARKEPRVSHTEVIAELGL